MTGRTRPEFAPGGCIPPRAQDPPHRGGVSLMAGNEPICAPARRHYQDEPVLAARNKGRLRATNPF
jgi:hypothetical protein